MLDQEADGTHLVGNANSSGLASSALRAYGLVPDANDVAAGVASLQLTSGADAGAIALNKADHDAAASSGISDAKRPVFERTTPQAVLALGLPSYVDRGVIPPVEPAPHITLSTNSVKAGDSITVTGGGFEAGEPVSGVVQSDPVGIGSTTSDAAGEIALTFTMPASVPAGAHTIRFTGADSGLVLTAPVTVVSSQVAATTSTTLRAAVTPAPIARTGNDSGDQSAIGFALLAAGGGLALIARRRRIVYPFKK
ncbi:MAG: hypothetical protein QOJ00_458 [Actinomycetota bacterium]